MSDLPAAQRNALEAWADDAIAAGWLSERDKKALQQTQIASPAQLFETSDRPLVVGFFGGTGVGKSTLLNRFAGEVVAHASVERPTSRAITVYVHRSVSVDRLPESFPMRKMRTALHNNDAYRHVLFIDMPDFDSVESANRDLVDIWLPHLDIVLYVVSPERYRDDQGWRLLLKHGSQHAWMFIMNHWDRGEPEQLEDFREQLSAAGLREPLLYRTDSSGSSGQSTDDFDDLQLAIKKNADESIIRSLGELGILSRLKAQKDIGDQWVTRIGTDETLTLLAERWSEFWNDESRELTQSLQGKAQRQAAGYAQRDVSWFEKWRGSAANTTPVTNTQLTLIDESVLTRIDNKLADFLNQQSQSLQLPVVAMKQTLAEPYARARRDVSGTVDDAVNTSLALPGNRAQRFVHRGLGLLCVILPLGAMGWIAFRVVKGFSEGGSNPAAYLGSNFAVNGALLLALSWLIPAFLQRKTRPSMEKAALRGLLQGLDAGLANVATAVGTGITNLQRDADALHGQYRKLWTALASPDTAGLPDPVKRMLVDELTQPVQRVLDVRANTHNSTDNAPVS